MTGEKRVYRKKVRAVRQEQTSGRILDATLAELAVGGIAALTVSAVAKRADVQRLTVYRHFPEETETALIRAAIAHWLAENPLPDPQRWRDAVDRADWPIAIVGMLYHHYRQHQAMWRVVDADVPQAALQAIRATLSAYRGDLIHDILYALPVNRRDGAVIRAVCGHVLAFSTWQSFAGQGLDDAESAALMADWLMKCPVG
jgi:AcrR family transcriptional regulator